MSVSSPGEASPGEPAPRGAAWAFGCALVMVFLFALRDVFTGPDPVGDDYAQYLLHARALANGLSYGETGYVFSSLQWGAGPPLLVPGYSTLVALFYLVMGQQVWIPGLISVVSVTLFVWVAGRYFWRLHTPWAGAFVACMVALACSQVFAAGTPGPDLLFCVMVWVIATLLDEREDWGWIRAGIILALALSAIAFRLAALPLVPALIVFGLFRFRGSGSRILLAGGGAALGFWWIYSLRGFGSIPPRPEYLLELIRELPRAAPDGPVPLEGFDLFKARVPTLVRSVFDLQVYPMPQKLANQVYHVLASLVMALGVLRWSGRGWRSFALLFLGAYVAMLVLLNFSVPRYMWPMAPGVAFAMWEGGRTLHGWVPARARGLFPAGAVLLVAVSTLTILRNPPPAPLQKVPEVRQVFDIIERERESTPDMRVAFFKARAMVWETGVPTAALFGHAHDPVVLAEVDALGITHVVVGNLYGEIGIIVRQWRRIVSERPDEFELVASAGDFGVYRVLR